MSETNETEKPRLKGQPVWLTMELYSALKAIKAAKGGTLAWHARRAVEQYVARFERTAQKETRGSE